MSTAACRVWVVGLALTCLLVMCKSEAIQTRDNVSTHSQEGEAPDPVCTVSAREIPAVSALLACLALRGCHACEAVDRWVELLNFEIFLCPHLEWPGKAAD